MNEIIIPIVSGVISAIIGSIVTALVSWRIQIRKEKREDLINQKKDQQDIYNKRPEFNIVEFKNYLDRKDGYGLRQKCDINIFLTLIYGAKITEKIVYANYKAEDFNKKIGVVLSTN